VEATHREEMRTGKEVDESQETYLDQRGGKKKKRQEGGKNGDRQAIISASAATWGDARSEEEGRGEKRPSWEKGRCEEYSQHIGEREKREWKGKTTSLKKRPREGRKGRKQRKS